ncbi:alpha-ketoglutarate-dependent dioxygenase AlkB family protein [Flavobacterium sp. 3HN19-14]|uniref:alpha-ketoglutarate-dependent dioxygenase AlkB family protein n=1 Tax=Flavobacterium sp. 3HN19-14 TaxID=3448133 RepID=UPI003EE32DEF
MDLFNPEIERNILPYDGTAFYYGTVLKSAEAQHYFEKLMQDDNFKNDEVIIFGKHIVTKRKIAWYGDNEFLYTYSNTTKQAHPWTPELLELKQKVEEITGTSFNSCLLNLYHDGDEGLSWHSDNEEPLGKNPVIASLSLGAERKFMFKHKTTKETVSIILENGSLLVMKDATQTHWAHQLPKSKKVKRARINMTFRTIVR